MSSKMIHSRFRGLIVCLSAVSLLSCQDEDFGYTTSDIKQSVYSRNFEKVFGSIDPNQNWDLYGQLAAASQKNVMTRGVGEITVSHPETNYQILTQEENMGYQAMLPESENNTGNIADTNLGKVTQNFSTSSKEITLYPVHWDTNGGDVIGIYYYVSSTEPGAVKITGTDGNTYYIKRQQVYENKTYVYGLRTIPVWEIVNVSEADFISVQFSKLHEIFPDKYILQGNSADNNAKKVIASSDGKRMNADVFFRDYPSEWKFDLAAAMADNEVSDGSYQDANGNKIPNGELVRPAGTIFSDPQSLNGPKCLTSVFGFNPPYTHLQSRPITIEIPSDIRKIGFYICQGSDYGYSESKLNSKLTFDVGIKEACYVATYEDENLKDENGDNVRYLCFEDWMGKYGWNFDMNDLVFRVYGLDTDNIVDYDKEETVESEEALLVCEDLGDYDFDFNDIVLKLSISTTTTTAKTYVNGVLTESSTVIGEPILTITPMAAGGSLESYILFKGTRLGESNNEIHQLLGGAAPTIINAGETFGSEGSPVSIVLSGDDAKKGTYPTLLSKLFHTGAFQILVENKTQAEVIRSDNYTKHGCPQMILLPVNFEWSQELNPIAEAYPGFTNWVNNTSSTNWINSQKEGNGLVTKKGGNVGPSVPDTTKRSLLSVMTNDKGGVPASFFDGMTTATITLTFAQSFNQWTTVFYGYAGDGNDIKNGYSNNAAPGNINGNDSNTVSFVLTTDQLAKVRELGNWGYEKKQAIIAATIE